MTRQCVKHQKEQAESRHVLDRCCGPMMTRLDLGQRQCGWENRIMRSCQRRALRSTDILFPYGRPN